MKKPITNLTLPGAVGALGQTLGVSDIQEAQALFVISRKEKNVQNAWQAFGLFEKEFKKDSSLKSQYFLSLISFLQVFTDHVNKILAKKLEPEEEIKYETDCKKYIKILLKHHVEILSEYLEKPLVDKPTDEVILDFYVACGNFEEDSRQKVIDFLETFSYTPAVKEKAIRELHDQTKVIVGKDVHRQFLEDLHDDGSTPPRDGYPVDKVAHAIARSVLYWAHPECSSIHELNGEFLTLLSRCQYVYDLSDNKELGRLVGRHDRNNVLDLYSDEYLTGTYTAVCEFLNKEVDHNAYQDLLKKEIKKLKSKQKK